MKSKREDLDIVLSDAPPFCCSNHLFPLGSNCNISSLVSSLQVTLCDTHKLFCFLFLAASCRICRMKAKMHHCYFSAFPMVRSQQQLEDKYTSKYLLPKLNQIFLLCYIQFDLFIYLFFKYRNQEKQYTRWVQSLGLLVSKTLVIVKQKTRPPHSCDLCNQVSDDFVLNQQFQVIVNKR